MRIVLTGGGTGGHIYPALAVAQTLQERGHTLLYVGNRTGLESTLVPQYDIAFQSVVFSGMPRRPGLGWLRWAWSLKAARNEAIRHVKAFRPHVAFGTGGYVAAPVLLAAKSLGVPYLIHEPDAHPGLVNRLMSRWAGGVTAAFEDSRLLLACRDFAVTGNPMRGEVGRLQKAEALLRLGLDWPGETPVLVVTGGSQGARTLNTAVAGALPALLQELGLAVIHQTGEKLHDSVMAAAGDLAGHPRYCARPFFRDMPAVLGAADVALCRAGSMTLSEMTLCGIPMILVPYPYAAADHQRRNAEALVRAGAAKLVLDAELSPERLLESIRPLLADPGACAAMAEASRRLGKPDAAARIADLLEAMAGVGDYP